MPQDAKRTNEIVSWSIGPAFVLVALGILAIPGADAPPPPVGTVIVDPASFTSDPPRPMFADPPFIDVGAYSYRCEECHRFFESAPETGRRLTQHEHIVLDHGLNARCFNCHDRADRDRLALEGTASVPFDDVALMCAKCHGPTFRDWELGIHGRTSGYWNDTLGEPVRLVCTECHDPHAPAFGPMSLLPGPNTLRMERPAYGGHEAPARKHNPLRPPWVEHP
jgi:hypothetical protein